MFSNDFDRELAQLGQKGLLRRIEDHGPSQHGGRVVIDGREHINFASNDYLGLASHRELKAAAAEAIATYGFGAGASRLLSGGTVLHAELERRVARFKGAARALLFNSGYAANTSVLPALAREGDVLFSDELNHASLIDGCRLSGAKRVIYRHRDTEGLAALLTQTEGRRKIVVTDSVFSMDGDLAPLGEIAALCKSHAALLYVDDAHGTGVLGSGRGGLAHFGITPGPGIVQMGTFSKALGSYGAFVAAEDSIIEWLLNRARGFIFSTALPACAVAASAAALSLVEEDAALVATLWRNRERLFRGIRDLGFGTCGSETPIVPVLLPRSGSEGDAVERVTALAALLRHRGIYAPAIRPPTVREPRLRVTVTAAHEEADIDALLDCLGEWRRRGT